MNRVSRILVKFLTFGTNDEETFELDQWRKEKEQHEELFQKISSREFLEEALDPRHKKSLDENWIILERKTLSVCNRKRFLRLTSWAASLLLLVVSAIIYHYTSQNKQYHAEMASTSIPKSKVIIDLAGGEQIMVYQDTVFQKNVENILVENRKDTISFSSDPARQVVSDKVHRIEVPQGGEYVARLEDGTIVHLDAASTLVIPQAFGKNKREVRLTGHAYFAVEKDVARPFIVKTGNVSVRVLGTEFDINAYKDQEMTTTLVKGLVEVSNQKSTSRLSPSQQAWISKDGYIEVRDVDVYPFVAWKDERIVFRNESLLSIMRAMERWYDVQAFFLSEDLKNETFTIDIEKYVDVEDALTVIEKTNKVKFEMRDTQIFIRKK